MTRPFVFYTSIKLPEFIGRKASTVQELLEGVLAADDSSLFHHTFHFLYQHQYAIPQPPSDFAYWTQAILLDHALAERLAAVNPVEFPSLRALRERLVAVFDEHMAGHRCSARAPAGMEFYFMRANSVVVRTPHTANDLPSFIDALERVSIGSLYHHMFEAKLRHEHGGSDFALWLEQELGLASAARKIAGLDPYFMTLQDIRRRIVEILKTEAKKR